MEGTDPVAATWTFVAFLIAVAAVAFLVRRVAVPYSVALVLLGLGVALVAPGDAYEVTPELVLVVLLPGLVFEAAYNMDVSALRRDLGGVVLLAVPGVLVSAVVVAVALQIGVGLRFELGFVVGAMVAATDPVAVISTFRRLRSPQRLVTLVEGESLFNDGTALVVFSIAVRSVVSPVGAQDWVTAFVGTVVVSVVIGVVAGWVASRVVATIDDRLVELTLSLATAYGTYALADSLHESGVLATVVAGIVLGSYGRRIGMSQRTEEAIDIVWEFIAFLLTALAFLLVGLAISVPRLLEAVWPIAFAVVGALVARAIVIYGLLNGLSRISWPGRLPRHVPVPWLHVMFWAGLRGAVAVAMALSLPAAFPERQLLQEITFGVVLFTLLFQGTTIGAVARRIRPTTAERTTDPRLGAVSET